MRQTKKPRIIILMHYLELGGAEMALIGMLNALDPDKVDVDLFIYSHQGPLMRFIPEWVNLLPEVKAYSMIERPMSESLRNLQFGVIAGRLAAKLMHRNYVNKCTPKGEDASIFSYIGKYVTPFLPVISEEEYDLCISFLIPHDIGLKKVKARKKIAWIHTDYSRMAVNSSIEKQVWGSYDWIASISPAVTDSFLQVFPEFQNKIVEIENIHSSRFVKERSEELVNLAEFYGCPTLLSIGRYSYAKNYDNIPDIARRLVNDYGKNGLRWYIIGFGDDNLIRKKIHEAGMVDHVILLGKKENPYPYIKVCDIYVQPSRYEGKSVTVREAQMLGRPVVVTSYPTASSQIQNGVDGIIVPLSNDGAAASIAALIDDRDKRRHLSSYLENNDYGNETEVLKIYRLIGCD